MEQLWTLVRYLQNHLALAAGGGVALIVLHRLLNRKSKLTLEVDRRLAELRRDRENFYNTLRPPN